MLKLPTEEEIKKMINDPPSEDRRLLDKKSEASVRCMKQTLEHVITFIKTNDSLVYQDTPVVLCAVAEALINLVGEFSEISKFKDQTKARNALATEKLLNDLRKTLNEAVQKNNRNMV